jgi:hypothetical protein
MHRKTPISVLVYNTLFPAPTPTDPPSFSAHLSKNLVGEVRIETATFYGSLDTTEARYPGLNYAHAPHRKRLGRFPHHKRLFEAFDSLRLTDSEIQGFCRWEGTLWARERYERDEGQKVEDTTGDGITEWVDRRKCRRMGAAAGRSRSGSSAGADAGAAGGATRGGISVKTDIEVEIQIQRRPAIFIAPTTISTTSTTPTAAEQLRELQQLDARRFLPTTTTDTEMQMHDQNSSNSSNSDSDPDDNDHDNDIDVHESIGFELNQRLMHAAALRDQGANVPMDPEWEQFLKDAQERGELNVDATREALRAMAEQWSQSVTTGVETQAQTQTWQPPAAPA